VLSPPIPSPRTLSFCARSFLCPTMHYSSSIFSSSFFIRFDISFIPVLFIVAISPPPASPCTAPVVHCFLNQVFNLLNS
jgi:hypothetical protein